MAVSKSAKIWAEMEKVKAKINEQQARLKELEQKHREAENEEIVDIVRGMSVSLDELPALLRQAPGRLWTRCPEARREKGGDIMKKSRMLAATLCAVLMVGVLTVPAYAGGGDEGGEYVPWVGLEPVEPLPMEQPQESKPFTPEGTGTVLDNATDQDGKEFFTITTADEAVFYLVIDRQRGAENVYFLNAVTVSDLMALAEPGQEPEAPPPVVEPEPEPDPAPEPEPQKTGGAGMLLAALAVLALGGGAGWYFKIYRPKQQKAAEPEEDYSSYDEPDGYDDEPPWDVDDEDEGGDE